MKTPTLRRRLARVVGWALGLALFAAAVAAVAAQRDSLQPAFTTLQGAPALDIALLALLTLATFLFIAAAFWVVTARYGHVAPSEMSALILAASLLNYLPLWPGMFGRLAYHRKVNHIPVSDSAKALIWANLMGLVAAVACAVTLVPTLLLLPESTTAAVAATAAPILAFAALAALAHARRPEPDPEVWRPLAAGAIRAAEILLWGARYWIAFRLIGVPLAPGAALLLAVVTRFAVFVPLAPNGLGVREWAVGILTPLLPFAVLGATIDMPQALAADLVNRAVEMAVALVSGLLAAAWLARRLRARGIRNLHADPDLPHA